MDLVTEIFWPVVYLVDTFFPRKQKKQLEIEGEKKKMQKKKDEKRRRKKEEEEESD